MHVNNSKGISNIYPNSNTELQKTIENANQTEMQKVKTDKADFSYQYEKAKENLISEVEHKLIDEISHDNRTEKIETLKIQIQSNHYIIDPAAIAAGMLSSDDEI